MVLQKVKAFLPYVNSSFFQRVSDSDVVFLLEMT